MYSCFVEIIPPLRILTGMFKDCTVYIYKTGTVGLALTVLFLSEKRGLAKVA